MNQPSEELRFAKNAIIMADAIHTGVQKLYDEGYRDVHPSMVEFARELIRQIEPHELIHGFIKNSHAECWDKIKERDEEFFINNVGKIFHHLPTDTVVLFHNLFMTKNDKNENVVSQDLKNSIWGLLDAMIKISIKYIAKHRKLQVDFYTEVDLLRHSTMWNVVI